ncbi:hypothetical protein DIGNKC_126 [Bacillus phage DIGNKC]|uniref:hypothetical protein n=1 Tax=Bacillus phage DIGNKC TaxID=1805948 RepID=UPI0007A77354|nr:hypothetical protein BI007_gp248 [Bacillus phage DIGNKC]AMW62645.1 hypothetical protein DIGNKC_126 [Bacillus phage DIGNKC]
MNRHQSMMKRIIDGFYNKEVVFFDEDTGWYSRVDGKYVDESVIEQLVEDAIISYECNWHDYREESK